MDSVSAPAAIFAAKNIDAKKTNAIDAGVLFVIMWKRIMTSTSFQFTRAASHPVTHAHRLVEHVKIDQREY